MHSYARLVSCIGTQNKAGLPGPLDELSLKTRLYDNGIRTKMAANSRDSEIFQLRSRALKRMVNAFARDLFEGLREPDVEYIYCLAH